MCFLLALLREEDGPTAVEYAVMLGAIIVVCIGIVGVIGLQTKQMMDPNGQLSSALGS